MVFVKGRLIAERPVRRPKNSSSNVTLYDARIKHKSFRNVLVSPNKNEIPVYSSSFRIMSDLVHTVGVILPDPPVQGP